MERVFYFDDGEIIVKSKNPMKMGSALEEVLKKLDRQAPTSIRIGENVYSKMYVPFKNAVPKRELCRYCAKEVAENCEVVSKHAGAFCGLERCVYVDTEVVVKGGVK